MFSRPRQLLYCILLFAAASTLAGETPPAFPLRSSSLLQVVDIDKDDDQSLGMRVELPAFSDIIATLRGVDCLVEYVNPAVDYKKMMRSPAECRGEVVRVESVLKYVDRFPLPAKNPTSQALFHRGFVSAPDGKMMVFISEAPIPAELAPGRGVRFTGIFLKKLAFLNRQDGDLLTMAPLIVVRRIEPQDIADGAPAKGAVDSLLPRIENKTDEVLIKERIVVVGHLDVTLKPDDPANPAKSKYSAWIDGKAYPLIPGGNHRGFTAVLEVRIKGALEAGDCQKNEDGTVTWPVRLSIPYETPMKEVERIVVSLAQAGLVNVQYRATNFSLPKR